MHTGGLIGALTQAAVREEDAHVYAEGIRRGSTLVSVRVADSDRARIESILARSAVDMSVRTAAWRKSGWSRFDENAKPYTADDIRRERAQYGQRGTL